MKILTVNPIPEISISKSTWHWTMNLIPHSQWLSLQSITQTSRVYTVFYIFLYFSLHKSQVFKTVTYRVVPQAQPASLATAISTSLPSLIHAPGELQNFKFIYTQIPTLRYCCRRLCLASSAKLSSFQIVRLLQWPVLSHTAEQLAGISTRCRNATSSTDVCIYS